MMIHRRNVFALAAAAALPALSRAARAQNYPARPITVIVPFAAGGPTDVLARLLAGHMTRTLGQNVVVEDVTGAAGSIGVGRVARAAPDGYTLILGNWATNVVNGAIYALPYDLLGDFAPIALLPANPMMIISNKTVPAKNLTELVAWIKASPHVTSGTAGVGSSSHITAVYFENSSGTHLQMVPYRGTHPALLDLIAGRIDIMFDQASEAMTRLHDGSVRAYAVTAKARSPMAPEVPTVDEAGLPGLYIDIWCGLWAPKGTPPDVILKLNRAAVAAMADPAVQKSFADLGLTVPPPDQQTPEALGALQSAEIKKWWPIVKAAGIKAE